MSKIQKTNAARLLDKAAVEYSTVAYEVDENDLAAAHVAQQLGEDYVMCSRHLCCGATAPVFSSASFRAIASWI